MGSRYCAAATKIFEEQFKVDMKYDITRVKQVVAEGPYVDGGNVRRYLWLYAYLADDADRNKTIQITWKESYTPHLRQLVAIGAPGAKAFQYGEGENKLMVTWEFRQSDTSREPTPSSESSGS